MVKIEDLKLEEGQLVEKGIALNKRAKDPTLRDIRRKELSRVKKRLKEVRLIISVLSGIPNISDKKVIDMINYNKKRLESIESSGWVEAKVYHSKEPGQLLFMKQWRKDKGVPNIKKQIKTLIMIKGQSNRVD